MTPQKLKNSILQLAIQGKLVEQRPEEGTAEELYKQIQAEKQALIRKKLIKEEKPLQDYEDPPFDIPDSWIWARITDCGVFISGFTPKTDELCKDGVIPYFKVSDMNTVGNELWLTKTEQYLKDPRPKKFFLKNTIVYPKNGGAVFTNKKRILAQDSIVDLNTGGYTVIGPVDLQYIYLYFSLIDFRQCYKGTALPTINMDKLKRRWIPLPPIEEQERIVAKIEELLPLVERYDKAWSRLENFNKRFPGDLQKSILQLAIQGKLVEQHENEGTAEELYQQIQAEKQTLIKAGKIKTGKTLPEITEDETPFEIPESWKWVRLDDLVTKEIKRGKSPTYVPQSGTLVFAQKCNTKAGCIDLSLSHFLDETKLTKYPESEFMRDKDIVINSTGNGTLGRVGFYRDSDNLKQLPLVPDSHVTVIRASSIIFAEYVFYGLKYYQPYLEKLGSGSTNQTELSAGTVRALLFPLPPLAEQKRIVAKLEEVLPLCDGLRKS